MEIFSLRLCVTSRSTCSVELYRPLVWHLRILVFDCQFRLDLDSCWGVFTPVHLKQNFFGSMWIQISRFWCGPNKWTETASAAATVFTCIFCTGVRQTKTGTIHLRCECNQNFLQTKCKIQAPYWVRQASVVVRKPENDHLLTAFQPKLAELKLLRRFLQVLFQCSDKPCTSLAKKYATSSGCRRKQASRLVLWKRRSGFLERDL